MSAIAMLLYMAVRTAKKTKAAQISDKTSRMNCHCQPRGITEYL
jgi:hypothetical protein